mgnify:CR=1 FL=1
MSDNKFTPGPWEWDCDGLFHRLPNGYKTPVAVPTYEYDSGTDINISEADAALVKAAPDLLEALQAIMNERWSPAGRSEHVSDMARSAIRKATEG